MAPHDLVFWASQPTAVFSTILVQPQQCERLMNYLVDPKIALTQCVALKDRFQERSEAVSKNPSSVGHKKFEKIALSSGIVKTLFQLAKSDRIDMEGVFTSYFAAEGLWNLIIIGTPEERRQLVKVYVEEHDVIHWCLELASTVFFVCLRTDWVRQLGDPSTTWQSMYCFGTVGAPTSKASKYAPRYYSLYQENAAWANIELMGRYPLPEQQYYNDLIKHDPSLLDLLFKCSLVKREAWYAQLEVDVRSLETVVFMLNLPVEMVPGLKLEVDDRAVQERLEQRWGALMDGVGLLTALPNWRRKITDGWKHIIEESPTVVNEMLKKAQKSHYAVEPYSIKEFMATMRLRGNFRIVVFRLMTTIAYAAETHPQSISDVDLLNFLPISHAGCQPVRTLAGMQDARSLDESAERVERTSVAYHQAGKMDSTMMSGKEDHALTKLKRLLSDAELRKTVGLSVLRLSERREIGNEAFRRDKQLHDARVEYWSAAQLGAALVEFDQVSNGKYTNLISGSKKELALCLGNAAEMSLGQEYFDRAFAEGGSGKDEVSQSVREKNERRINRAKEGIAGRRESS
ncbi:hypothetical protein FA13DRAFT_1748169 [Coprinellus micaceus]|uniref:Uncharacterized protein n=1 Tax=Coprinellus micaceus TaxID=71717 RepID=A0A4Y7RY81_COPMI|nr:hypothetical protein FA13DRAFT_1748169 [Coprinellus micaceus]